MPMRAWLCSARSAAACAPRHGRRLRRQGGALLLVMALGLGACQPVDEFGASPRQATRTPTQRPIDAPVFTMPATLEELTARGLDVAVQWQDEPRLAEVAVDLESNGTWRRAQLLYVAADADRFLTVVVTRDGVSDERTTLAAIDRKPITRRGMSALPELPDGVREPADLAAAAAPALRRCDVFGRVQQVLYASGAPVAWGGRRWVSPPQWAAAVATSRGAVTLDPVTAEAQPC